MHWISRRIGSITDERGVIKHVNDELLPDLRDTTAGEPGWSDIIASSGSNHHPSAFIVQMWQTISRGKVWNGEFRNKAKDGSIYWVDMTIVPFLNDRNEPYEYMALDSDITERKKAEGLLSQSYLVISASSLPICRMCGKKKGPVSPGKYTMSSASS